MFMNVSVIIMVSIVGGPFISSDMPSMYLTCSQNYSQIYLELDPLGVREK